MAREYATQMEAARKGIITEELKSVAKKERMSVEEYIWVHMQLWIFLHTEIPYRFAAN